MRLDGHWTERQRIARATTVSRLELEVFKLEYSNIELTACLLWLKFNYDNIIIAQTLFR